MEESTILDLPTASKLSTLYIIAKFRGGRMNQEQLWHIQALLQLALIFHHARYLSLQLPIKVPILL